VKLVAGLGNPGPRYDRTRHNVGFQVLDELARRWNVAAPRYERRYEALVADDQVGDQRVVLLWPQTYMNLSGRSVLAVKQFFKLDPTRDLLVVCDDMDLPVGRIRLRARGSGGGQKGLENILLRLGTTDVPRLRIGIGRAPAAVAAAYVLSRFAPGEQQDIEEAISTAADAVECWLRRGIDAAMNRFNTKAGGQRGGKRKPATDDASEGESS